MLRLRKYWFCVVKLGIYCKESNLNEFSASNRLFRVCGAECLRSGVNWLLFISLTVTGTTRVLLGPFATAGFVNDIRSGFWRLL